MNVGRGRHEPTLIGPSGLVLSTLKAAHIALPQNLVAPSADAAADWRLQSAAGGRIARADHGGGHIVNREPDAPERDAKALLKGVSAVEIWLRITELRRRDQLQSPAKEA